MSFDDVFRFVSSEVVAVTSRLGCWGCGGGMSLFGAC